ncbi:MAG: MFS transporter, partial [Shimia sp.]
LRSVGQLSGLYRLLAIVFLYEFAFIVYPAIWAYFGPEAFGWSAQMVGWSLGGFGISMALVQGVLIRVLIPRLGERKVIFWGMTFNVGIFITLAFMGSGTIVLLLTPIAALGAVVTPALQGLMSRAADDDQQGELQGTIVSAKALATMLSPLVMAATFFAFTRPDGVYLPGAPFLLSAVLVVVCFVIFVGNASQTRGA